MDPQWLDPEELETWTSFLAVSQLIDEQIEATLRRDWGLTHSEYDILSVLSQQPEHKMRMGHLARAMVTAKSALSYRIASLERAGLVVRVRLNDDGRGLEALLTAKGERLLEEAAPDHVRSVRRYFIDALDPSELTQLRSTMAKLLASLQSDSLELEYATNPCTIDPTDQDCRERGRIDRASSTPSSDDTDDLSWSAPTSLSSIQPSREQTTEDDHQ